ncbi:uncharacterized protein SPSK_02092 [Sporothrix schenckii 1099-18]|uniref:Uncharacterized protein n=1 Tax=Sporothrix schenckii 1099-18 TaxID=1397361 RepID=A0A0F2MFZ6_SPOSC|nr:uncharacterized protein SPSK_02092 [Sporothrix schenckii 1099-18]KJR87086.1 hypothetical protein SPSK_02092 [Sporothrix schenckii 1099-18]
MTPRGCIELRTNDSALPSGNRITIRGKIQNFPYVFDHFDIWASRHKRLSQVKVASFPSRSQMQPDNITSVGTGTAPLAEATSGGDD